jgi:curved DNA-binding protein CbpA
MNDPYEVLQVDRGATHDVIRSAYRTLARKHHPDFGGDSRLMVAINTAWAVLGDPARRAAFDAQPRPAVYPRSVDTTAEPAASETSRTGHGLAARRRQEQPPSGTVLDFGRYAGQSVGSIAELDPDYLAWLARTPLGRRLSAEIDAILARVEAAAAPLAAKRPEARRSFFNI